VSTPGLYVPTAFVWPYLLYRHLQDRQATGLRLYNFVTGQDGPFTADVDFGSLYSSALADGTYVITDDSIVATVLTGQVVDSAGVVTSNGITSIFTLDHILSGGTGLRELAHFNGDLGMVLGADSRLIAGCNGVWDETLHEFVTFPHYLGVGQCSDADILSFRGGYLAVGQSTYPDKTTVLIFKSAALPASAVATGG
jgi:hypothetical protein